MQLKGFILLELVVAISIIGLGILALLQAQFVAHQLNAKLSIKESQDTMAQASCSAHSAQSTALTCIYGQTIHWYQGE